MSKNSNKLTIKLLLNELKSTFFKKFSLQKKISTYFINTHFRHIKPLFLDIKALCTSMGGRISAKTALERKD